MAGIKYNNKSIYPQISIQKAPELFGSFQLQPDEEIDTRSMGDSFASIDQDGYWIIVYVNETVPSNPQIIQVRGFSKGTPKWSLIGDSPAQDISLLPTENIVFIFLW